MAAALQLALADDSITRVELHGAGRDATQSEAAASATALLCDAAVASYLREVLDDTSRRMLGAGWVVNLAVAEYLISRRRGRRAGQRPRKIAAEAGSR